jgi:hypothetical protein
MQTLTGFCRWPALIMRLVLCLTLVGLILAPAGPVAQARLPAAEASPFAADQPLAELLNPDGTLNLAAGFRGSLDARGWQLMSGPGEAPRFAPLAAASDENWAEDFGPPGTDGAVFALAVDGDNLYVGGRFGTAGGISARRVAMWDGKGWSALGSGLGSWRDDYVAALAVDGNGNLYAGGYFPMAGSGDHIARWDGSSWHSLGYGMDARVYALAVDGSGNLYAGGEFTGAGDVSADYVARWDGSDWSSLGNGMDASVLALAVDSGNLYAGGSFTMAGGVNANRIAMWDGSSWSRLGDGMNGAVRALAVDGSGNLYAGGRANVTF